jgi:membrane-bound ClpP family serine protease
MPWSSRRLSRLATNTSLMLGFIASLPINLASSWFQQDVISNPFLATFLIIMLVAIFYLVLKMRAPRFIANATATFIAGIFLNLLSWVVQVYILHNSFTILNVLVILLVGVICSVLTAFIAAHPIRNFENKLKRKRRVTQSRVRLASKGKANNRKQSYPKKNIKRRPKKKSPLSSILKRILG